MSIIQDYLEENTSIDALFPILQPFCVFFMNRTNHYNGPYMCPGLIHSYGPVVSAVLDIASYPGPFQGSRVQASSGLGGERLHSTQLQRPYSAYSEEICRVSDVVICHCVMMIGLIV